MYIGFLPSTMTDTILVPIIKDKTGNASSKANYRPIALTSVLSKVFETAFFYLNWSLYSKHRITSLVLNHTTRPTCAYIR